MMKKICRISFMITLLIKKARVIQQGRGISRYKREITVGIGTNPTVKEGTSESKKQSNIDEITWR
jgi:hypothetical protein